MYNRYDGLISDLRDLEQPLQDKVNLDIFVTFVFHNIVSFIVSIVSYVTYHNSFSIKAFFVCFFMAFIIGMPVFMLVLLCQVGVRAVKRKSFIALLWLGAGIPSLIFYSDMYSLWYRAMFLTVCLGEVIYANKTILAMKIPKKVKVVNIPSSIPVQHYVDSNILHKRHASRMRRNKHTK